MGISNITLDDPLYNIVDKNIVMLQADSLAEQAVKAMKDKGVRCVLVLHNNEAIGIVTKTDILFKVIAQGKSLSKVRVREIMSSPVITLPASSSIEQALRVMEKHDIRQVLVGSSYSIVGMVSREELLDILHKVSENTKAAIEGSPVCIINPKALAMLKDADKLIKCPYCDSEFNYKDELSRHIDRVHTGSGLLEGDLRRMFE